MSVSDSVRNLVNQHPIVALATVAIDGTPNVAPIYWKLWYDDSTLLLIDNYMNATKANISSTGTAAVSAWNADSGEAYQLKGVAHYYAEGPKMDAAVEYMNNQKPGSHPKGVVVIQVESVYIQTPGEHAGDPLE